MTEASSASSSESALYQERYRPQFHFTAQRNWLNDPNGLVYFAAEYHLFFQHNPTGREWGNMHWGHAISPDLVHWTELPLALTPDEHGPVFSGSAVVDWQNSSGLGDGIEPPLVILYTGAGNPEVQCLAYSRDRGRTWQRDVGNPVVPHLTPGNRDPKVICHALTERWVMVLYVREDEVDGIRFFTSPNLREWAMHCRIDGYYECPDLFELPLEGQAGETRWVLLGADGEYQVGAFDGETFTPETPKLPGDWGANFYAAQTYSDIPAEDGRRIQIAWMRGGGYPGMPFNQQMSFPCVLTLHATEAGPRVFRWPVQEIESLRGAPFSLRDQPLPPGENPLASVSWHLVDLRLEVEPGAANALELSLNGATLRYSVADGTLTCMDRTVHLPLRNGRLQLRVLLDRTSIEVFENSGELSITSCFLPNVPEPALGITAQGGVAQILSLDAFPLRSAWR